MFYFCTCRFHFTLIFSPMILNKILIELALIALMELLQAGAGFAIHKSLGKIEQRNCYNAFLYLHTSHHLTPIFIPFLVPFSLAWLYFTFRINFLTLKAFMAKCSEKLYYHMILYWNTEKPVLVRYFGRFRMVSVGMPDIWSLPHTPRLMVGK